VQANTISTRIATLGGPPVTIAPPAAKAASAKSDTSAVKKRQHARSELRRRRNAARARLEKQMQTLDAFGQPTSTAR
jgi:DNA-binding ferritin-like protein